MKKEKLVEESKWFTYMVECSDNTFYTGISTDVFKRIIKHNSGKGAKYTKARTPVKLVYVQKFDDKSSASKEEWRIKQLTREEKLQMINEPWYQSQWEEEQNRRISDLYTYGEDGFCDGFTKY
jgi:putative endonuclease